MLAWKMVFITIVSILMALGMASPLAGQDPVYIILREPPRPASSWQRSHHASNPGRVMAQHPPQFNDGRWVVQADNPNFAIWVPANSANAMPDFGQHQETLLNPSLNDRSAISGHAPYGIVQTYRQPYAYGWFGASSRPQSSRSHGYYRSRTTWTFQ